MWHQWRHSAFALLAAFSILAAACSSGDGNGDENDDPTSEAASSESSAGQGPSEGGDSVGNGSESGDSLGPISDGGSPDAEVRGGVGQVMITHAEVGAPVAVRSSDGELLGEGEADSLGSFVVRGLSGQDVEVVVDGGSATVTVLDPDGPPPDQSFYEGQTLEAGFNYIETRDGTLLSATVFIPAGEGPFPTVVEYSGYGASEPGRDFIETIQNSPDFASIEDPTALCDTVAVVCSAPAQPGSLIFHAFDYAVVSVNMRGSGCSGGAFEYFGPEQITDGYDVIETVAAQDFVANSRVGMVGLSWPGISQLFTAAAQPPGLAAISPLAVFDDVGRDVVAPGGVFNEGFAGAYSTSIDGSIGPYGMGWTQRLVDEGDEVCAENQLLREQNIDLIELSRSSRYYPPELADPRNVSTFADKIEVPVFLVGSYQDAQLGPSGLHLADQFVNSRSVRVEATNGAHAEGFAPETLLRIKDFMDIYVGDGQAPVPPLIGLAFPSLLGEQAFGVTVPFPPAEDLGETQEEQIAAWEAKDPYVFRFERGGDAETSGLPISRFTWTTDEWTSGDDGDEATFWLSPGGVLGTAAPTEAGTAAEFDQCPDIAEITTLPGEGPTTEVPFKFNAAYDWQVEPDGCAAAWVSEPLTEDLVWIGEGAAHVWMRSSAVESDIGVTVTEVRPDGQEMFVQIGVMRPELRAPGATATESVVDQEGLEADAAPIVPGEWTEVSIPIFFGGHIFRAGSSIEVSFHTPGLDRPTWSWDIDQPPAGAVIALGQDVDHPSRISFDAAPEVTGYPADLPVCGASPEERAEAGDEGSRLPTGTRGQPCRAQVPIENREVS